MQGILLNSAKFHNQMPTAGFRPARKIPYSAGSRKTTSVDTLAKVTQHETPHIPPACQQKQIMYLLKFVFYFFMTLLAAHTHTVTRTCGDRTGQF
jgi:hypothetical protein